MSVEQKTSKNVNGFDTGLISTALNLRSRISQRLSFADGSCSNVTQELSFVNSDSHVKKRNQLFESKHRTVVLRLIQVYLSQKSSKGEKILQ